MKTKPAQAERSAIIHTATRTVLVEASGCLLLVCSGEMLEGGRYFAFNPEETRVVRLNKPAEALLPFERHMLEVRQLIDSAYDSAYDGDEPC